MQTSLVARPGRVRLQCRSPIDNASSPATTASPSSPPILFQYTTRQPTGLVQHGIRSRLRATYPYLLGAATHLCCTSNLNLGIVLDDDTFDRASSKFESLWSISALGG